MSDSSSFPITFAFVGKSEVSTFSYPRVAIFQPKDPGYDRFIDLPLTKVVAEITGPHPKELWKTPEPSDVAMYLSSWNENTEALALLFSVCSFRIIIDVLRRSTV